MTAKKTIPAVGYIRMSSSKQEKSPEQQREEIQKLAERQGYRIIRWYDWDMGISGDDTERRKAFQQMSADAKTKRDFKVILCWDYSRFGRFDSIEGGKWIAPLRDAGVQLVTCTEGLIDWTSFTGRVMNALYSEGKNQYLIDLSKNVIRGKLKSAKAGHLCGSAAPLGYDRIVVDPQTDSRTRLKRGQKALKPVGWYTTLDLSDDPAEVEVVKWIFEQFTTKRVTLLSIARELNRRGTKGTFGGRWTGRRIKQVLSHPVYAGDLAWNRTRQGKYFCYFKGEIREGAELAAAGIGPGLGTCSMPVEEWVISKDAVPAIISRETWNRTQRRLDERSSTRRQPREGGHPLSGYIYCGHCGCPMYGCSMTKRWGEKAYEYRKYRCRSRQMFGDERCGNHEVHEAPLLDFVFKSIRDAILSDANMQRLERELVSQLGRANESDPGKERRLTKAINDLKAKIAKGTENLLLANREEMPAMRELLAGWRQRRDALQAELAAAVGPRGTKADERRLLQAAMKEAQRLNEYLDSDDPARLREVIDTVVDRIDLWFSKEKCRTGTHRYHFSRGLLVLKADFFSRTVDTSSK